MRGFILAVQTFMCGDQEGDSAEVREVSEEGDTKPGKEFWLKASVLGETHPNSSISKWEMPAIFLSKKDRNLSGPQTPVKTHSPRNRV